VKVSRNYLLSFYVIVIAILLLVPSLAIAQSATKGGILSTSFDSGTFKGLQSVADRFRNKGERSTIAVGLPTLDGGVTVQLEPHDIRSSNYHATLSNQYGQIDDPFQVDLFKARDEQGDDFYRFSLVRNKQTGEKQFIGYFRKDRTFYHLAPANEAGLDYSVDALTTEEVEKLLESCGVDHSSAHELLRSSAARTDRLSRVVAEATLRVVEIATDADFEYVQAEGGSTSANANILAIINATDALYRAQLGSRFSVTYQNAWTVSNDPYSSSDAETLLNQFVNYWQSNFSSSKTYDVAHLWTGRDLDGSTIGIAYVSALCSSFRYGLSQRLDNLASDIPLFAHEAGHNFGSGHDSCGGSDEFVMCPFLISGADTFSTSSRNQISSHLASSNCLASEDDGDSGGSNSAPVLDPIGPQSVTEGQTLTFSVSGTDADNDTITFSASGLSGASITGSTFSYTPSVGTVPSNSNSTTQNVTIRASDGTDSDSEEVVIMVISVDGNQAPNLAKPAARTIAAGQNFSLSLSAQDPENDALTFSAPSGLPAGATLTTAGLFRWTPGGNQIGSYEILFQVRDTVGNVDSETFSLTVGDSDAPDNPEVHIDGDFDLDGNADLVVFRPSTGEWYTSPISSGQTARATTVSQFGLPGDIPVMSDYDGDNRTDLAVFRPSVSTWFVRNSATGVVSSIPFGLGGDLPLRGGDFDGDGRADLAVFRPSFGTLFYRASNNGAVVPIQIGQKGDVPVVCDFDGDGRTDAAVYRPGTGIWRVLIGTMVDEFTFGERADIPVPGDYNGDGACELRVYRPSTSEWIGFDNSRVTLGQAGDVPVPLDYNGDGSTDLGVFTPRTGQWTVRAGGDSSAQWGLPSDYVAAREWSLFASRNTNGPSLQALSSDVGSFLAYDASIQQVLTVGVNSLLPKVVPSVPGSTIIRGDYDGDGALDVVNYTNGLWTVYLATGGVFQQPWGLAGDTPISADFDGDGKNDIAVFRPQDLDGLSKWYVIRSSDGSIFVYNWGLPGDVPVVADFTGDGWSDPAVFRPSNGTWFVLDGRANTFYDASQWGLSIDTPRVVDFDGDGRPDKAVWRFTDGTFYVQHSAGGVSVRQWGIPGDVPVPGSYLAAGSTDYAVYRPSTRQLFVLSQNGASFAFETGLSAIAQVVGQTPPVPTN
jgi:hypothetical protein